VRRDVALFVTCLADLMRPSVAFNAIELLEKAGCEVTVPLQQTCCGQPGYNTGDFSSAAALARQLIEQFEPYDYVVAPSGSCAGMICHHYPGLLEGQWHDRALNLAAKTFELTTFLTEIAALPAPGRLPRSPSVTYHDSCAGLRELGVRQQPRQLLKQCGVQVLELERTEVCCGFGGTFCAKMPELSAKMAKDKLDNAVATGADILAGGDLGCLLNLSGRARRLGHTIEVRHVAEILNGDLSGPGIGEGES
jgi:L-lactate dehydrogenase complex protein LldE